MRENRKGHFTTRKQKRNKDMLLNLGFKPLYLTICDKQTHIKMLAIAVSVDQILKMATGMSIFSRCCN